jgi:hypothetical protein
MKNKFGTPFPLILYPLNIASFWKVYYPACPPMRDLRKLQVQYWLEQDEPASSRQPPKRNRQRGDLGSAMGDGGEDPLKTNEKWRHYLA